MVGVSMGGTSLLDASPLVSQAFIIRIITCLLSHEAVLVGTGIRCGSRCRRFNVLYVATHRLVSSRAKTHDGMPSSALQGSNHGIFQQLLCQRREIPADEHNFCVLMLDMPDSI